MSCACAENEMRMPSYLLGARAHFILVRACASHFVIHVLILFCYARAHLFLLCPCASHFGIRISFWVRMRISILDANEFGYLVPSHSMH